jgi:glycosyltransferase involved in cell wall biosynthesis
MIDHICQDNAVALRQQWDREYALLSVPHEKYRFHVVGLPPTAVCNSTVHPCDTMTYGIRGIIRILHGILGHHVTFYGSEDSDVDCDEHVVVNTVKDRERWYGDKGKDEAGRYAGGIDAPPMGANEPPYVMFNRRVIGALDMRLEPHDFILIQGGFAQQIICTTYPTHHSVEFLIGYDGSCAPFRIFQTYTHMQYTYGLQGLGTGRDFDDAGYGFYYPPEEFPYSSTKGDYFAFIGRPFANKGPHIAGQVCKHLGAKLIVAGQGAKQDGEDVICGDGTKIEHAEYVGVVAGAQRAKLMGEALALFAPTNYREPFASVTQEAAMCGTPSITSDHGCFPETIVNGVNGFRCRSFKQYVEAAKLVPDLDTRRISDRAITLYSEEVLARRYQTYFTRLYSLWDKGWYAL